MLLLTSCEHVEAEFLYNLLEEHNIKWRKNIISRHLEIMFPSGHGFSELDLFNGSMRKVPYIQSGIEKYNFQAVEVKYYII